MANRFPLWGQAGWASAEVVGETHYAKAIRALFGNDFDPRGTDINIPVQLIPDRNNRHDRNAVGVWSGSSLLGHLPRPEAARYVGVLTALTARDLTPEVNARITGREWGAADGRPAAFDSTIRLDLAEPHMLVPANPAPPREHRLLPSGSAAQVVGQQQFLDALVPLLRPEGECWAYVTLHEMADHLVEVRIGDTRVGDLSPKMSGELLPALRHMAEQGLVTAARAIVRGNSGKSEVMLYVARAQDLPESWQGPAKRPGAAPGADRGTASVPAPGVATTGSVTPGPGPVGVPGANPPANSVPGRPTSGGPAYSGQFPTTGNSLPPGSGGQLSGGPGSGNPLSGGPGSGNPLSGGPGSGNPLSGSPGTGGLMSGGPGNGGLMSGGPASGGLVPNWVSGDALPSWAAPASTNPAVTLAPATSALPPSSPVSPATSFQPGATGSSFPSTFASSLGSAAPHPSDSFPGQSATGGFPAGTGGTGDSSPGGRTTTGSFDADDSGAFPAGGAAAGSGSFPAGGTAAGPGALPAGGGSAGSGAFSTGTGGANDPADPVPSWASAGPSGLDSGVPGWSAGDGRLGWSTTGDSTPSWATAGDSGPSWSPPGENAPSWSPPGDGTPSWSPSGENKPSWSSPGDSTPGWSPPGESTPGWSPTGESTPGDDPQRRGTAGGGAPSWSMASGAVPNVPSGGPLAGSGTGRHAATGSTIPVPQVEGPGSLLTDPLNRPLSPAGPAGPVSPGMPTVGNDYAIAETTVIPALTAVVKANSGAIAGLNPVSAAPDSGNPHAPIPPAPTGIKFVVPDGWPTPPAGWYPPEGWRPDPSWPPAPSGWQFWLPTWD